MIAGEYHQGNYPALIISAALTGAVPSKEKYPNLPVTPKEIAKDALACAALGAQIVHIHMRDDSGNPSQDVRQFRETIELIRSENDGLVICATTTSRGSNSLEDRLVPLQLPDNSLPDMVSLTLGSYNTPYGINANPQEHILAIAEAARERGVAIEGEVFEIGMLSTYNRLVESGYVRGAAILNFLLGVQGALPATAGALTDAVRNMPAGVEWAAAGIGHFQGPINLMAIAMGGNVRVGMEDDPRGARKNWSNEDAVQRAVEFARLSGRRLATSDEVRTRLRLGSRGHRQ